MQVSESMRREHTRQVLLEELRQVVAQLVVLRAMLRALES